MESKVSLFEKKSQLTPNEEDRFRIMEEINDLFEVAEMIPNTKKRVAIAKEILAKDSECSDAYLLLAENASKTPQEAISYLESAISVAERKVGTKKFEVARGHFWGMTETRPYMRARYSLAAAFWEIGRRQEAIFHLEEMLELNPSDNQGLRYFLVNWYLFVGNLKSAEKLYERYGDDIGLEFVFGKALSLFIKEGETTKANSALHAAFKRNPLAVSFLLDPGLIPEELPDYYSIGSEEEALLFAYRASEVWMNLYAAMQWLQRESRNGRKKKK